MTRGETMIRVYIAPANTPLPPAAPEPTPQDWAKFGWEHVVTVNADGIRVADAQ